MLRIAILALVVGLLGGCQSSGRSTASGRPEVMIPARPSDAKAAIIGTFLNLGGSLQRDSEFQLVIGKTVETRSANVLLGAMRATTVDYRITFTLLPLGDSTRVVAEGVMVTDDGSGSAKVASVNTGKDAIGLQRILSDIARGFSSGYPIDTVISDAVAAAKDRSDIALTK